MAVCTIFPLRQAHAALAAETLFGALFASLAADGRCLNDFGHDEEGLEICHGLALLADPPAPGITSLSISIAYDQSKFVFDPLGSSFLCQFSVNGDCPAANAPGAGTFPFTVLPASITPGDPLPGSSVTLTDTAGVVTLTYVPASPVITESDSNFFLFSFLLKDPVLVSVPLSTVTYSNAATPFGSGLQADFTQSSFVCTTTIIPDHGCGSPKGVTGVTVNFAIVPEPSSVYLLSVSLIFLLIRDWRRYGADIRHLAKRAG